MHSNPQPALPAGGCALALPCPGLCPPCPAHTPLAPFPRPNNSSPPLHPAAPSPGPHPSHHPHIPPTSPHAAPPLASLPPRPTPATPPPSYEGRIVQEMIRRDGGAGEFTESTPPMLDIWDTFLQVGGGPALGPGERRRTV